MIEGINTLKVKLNDHAQCVYIIRSTSVYNEEISQQPYPGGTEKSVAMTFLPLLPTNDFNAPGCRYINQWYESQDKTNTNRRDANSGWYWIYLCSTHAMKMNKQSNKQSFQMSEELNTQKSTRVEEHSKSDGGKLLKSNNQETLITSLLHLVREDSIATAGFLLSSS